MSLGNLTTCSEEKYKYKVKEVKQELCVPASGPQRSERTQQVFGPDAVFPRSVRREAGRAWPPPCRRRAPGAQHADGSADEFP